MIAGDETANNERRGTVRRRFMIMGERRATVRRRFTVTGDETANGERCEAVEELLDLLALAQKMGRRLAYETHGESYEFVRELNEHLHQAREEIKLIQQTLTTVR